MFEPENDLERSLMRASADAAHRPEFLRQLMDADIFLALMALGGQITVDADGKSVIPAGTTLELKTVRKGENSFIPFFSAPVRAKAVFRDGHIIAPDKTRDAFERYPDAQFVLNPGSDFGKEFLRGEIDRLLAGDFDADLRRVVMDGASQALLTYPTPYPADLVTALAALFAAMPSIKAAHLGQITLPGEGAELLVAIDADIGWVTLMEDLRPRLGAALPKDRIVNFAPLAGGPFEDYFRPQTPFFARSPVTDH